MPFYEYCCDKCSHQFEVFHGINERPEILCELCKGAVRRVLFAPGVIFKGGGFYATEYGRATHNNPRKSDGKKPTESAPKPSEAASSSPAASTTSASSGSSTTAPATGGAPGSKPA